MCHRVEFWTIISGCHSPLSVLLSKSEEQNRLDCTYIKILMYKVRLEEIGCSFLLHVSIEQ